MTGKRFGRLVAVRPHCRRGRRIVWLFRCDCGNEHQALGENVRSGATASCGCLRVDVARSTVGPLEWGHGDARHGATRRLYRIWLGMRDRCRNPNRREFRLYGGRGITVCDEWNDYTVFRAWAETHGYADDLTIDRIDPDQGYFPTNCRWITREDNARLSRRPGTVTGKLAGEVIISN